MVIVPFLTYFALVALMWYIVGKILPGLYGALRKLGTRFARTISERGITEKVLPFLPNRLLVLKPYATLIVVILAGLGIALVAGDQFFDLAESMRQNNEILLSIDQTVHDWTQHNRHPFLTPFYLTFSVLGDPIGLSLILSIGVTLALLRREWNLAGYLILTAGLGGLLNRWLKTIFGRDRPDLLFALSDAAHESFPSGHTMGSVIILGALAYASLHLTRHWRWKSLWVAVAIVSSLTIALSRIYLGVHWTSDIAAGYAAGFAWLACSIAVFETYLQLRRRGRAGEESISSGERGIGQDRASEG